MHWASQLTAGRAAYCGEPYSESASCSPPVLPAMPASSPQRRCSATRPALYSARIAQQREAPAPSNLSQVPPTHFRPQFGSCWRPTLHVRCDAKRAHGLLTAHRTGLKGTLKTWLRRHRASPAGLVVDGVDAQRDEEAGDGEEGRVRCRAHDAVQHRRHGREQRRRVRLLRNLVSPTAESALVLRRVLSSCMPAARI